MAKPKGSAARVRKIVDELWFVRSEWRMFRRWARGRNRKARALSVLLAEAMGEPVAPAKLDAAYRELHGMTRAQLAEWHKECEATSEAQTLLGGHDGDGGGDLQGVGTSDDAAGDCGEFAAAQAGGW